MVLVANKIDMESSRVIASRLGMELADKYNMLYVETSAKTGLNVEDAYVNLAKTIFQQNNLNQNIEYTEAQIKEMDARGIKVHSKNSRPSNITLGPNQSRGDSGMCCS
jgi:GTPase SAR1 family protein